MAVLNTNFTNLTTYPNSFSRQEPTPLEAHSLFTSKTDAENYAKNDPVAYVGQIIVVIDATNKVCTPYVISDTTGTLGEIGGNVDLDDYVTGPSSSTDTAIAVFNGTDGKTIKNTGVTINSSNVISTAGGIKLTNGNCTLRLYNTSASPTDYSAIEVRSNSTSTNRNLFIDLANNSLVVGAASGTADTTYKMKVDGTFGVTGTATANGFIHSGLTAASEKTKDDYVLLAGGGTKPLSEFGISGDSAGNFTAPITITTDASAGTVVNAINITTSTRSGTAMKVIPYDKNGTGIILGDGGIFLAGSGESATNLWNDVLKNSASGGSENTYITSDGSIYLVSNCNTTANCKQVIINGSGIVSAAGFEIFSGATWKYNSSTDCVELVW